MMRIKNSHLGIYSVVLAIVIGWFIFLSVLLGAEAPKTPGIDPSQLERLVRSFYDAVNLRDCATARTFYRKFSDDECRSMPKVKLETVQPGREDKEQGVVFLTVTYQIQKRNEKGKRDDLQLSLVTRDVALYREQNQWMIQSIQFGSNPLVETTTTPVSPKAFTPDVDAMQKLSVQPPQRNMPLSFGSQHILTALWTVDVLQGSSKEKEIQRLRTPDRRPPKRQTPREKPHFPVVEPNLAIRRVSLPKSLKIIALTFDLCEEEEVVAGYDAAIVDYLRKEGIPATFFAGGKWMQSHPDRTMQLMADPLFEIGNHSWSHANLRTLTEPHLTEQILWTQGEYERLRDELQYQAQQQQIDQREIAQIPSLPRIFRFPYGTCSPQALQAVTNAGLSAIQWDVVSGDPDRYQTVTKMVNAVVDQTQRGSILIFHANGRGHVTANALPQIISRLRTRGYEFVTVSDLLRLAQQTGEVINGEEECYEQRPGDNKRYDKLTQKISSK